MKQIHQLCNLTISSFLGDKKVMRAGEEGFRYQLSQDETRVGRIKEGSLHASKSLAPEATQTI